MKTNATNKMRFKKVGAPFPSTKAAVAAVARMSQWLDYPKQLAEPTRTTADTEADVSDARRVMLACGVDLDSEEAELLYRWATTRDERLGDVDIAVGDPKLGRVLEQVGRRLKMETSGVLRLVDGLVTREELERAAKGVGAAEAMVRRAGERKDRLEELRGQLTVALAAEGIIPPRRRPKLRVHKVGYVVHEYPDGTRQRMLVLDPDPSLDDVVTGPDAPMVADAIVAGIRAGPVRPAEFAEVRKVMHPKLRNELLPLWSEGKFGSLTLFDGVIAERLDCTPRHARRVRRSWGVEGSRGPAPTTPPEAA